MADPIVIRLRLDPPVGSSTRAEWLGCSLWRGFCWPLALPRQRLFSSRVRRLYTVGLFLAVATLALLLVATADDAREAVLYHKEITDTKGFAFHAPLRRSAVGR